VHAALVKAVVIASSDKAYGDTETLPYTEGHPLVGRHPYDVSKSCTDLLATAYHRTYGCPWPSPAAGTSTAAATSTGVALSLARFAPCCSASPPSCGAMARWCAIISTSRTP